MKRERKLTETIIRCGTALFRALAYIGSELKRCIAVEKTLSRMLANACGAAKTLPLSSDNRWRRTQRARISRFMYASAQIGLDRGGMMVCGCSFSSSLNERLQYPARIGNPVPGLFLWRRPARDASA